MPKQFSSSNNLISTLQRVTRMGESGTGQERRIAISDVAANSTDCGAVHFEEPAGVDKPLLAPCAEGGFDDSKPFQILASVWKNMCLNCARESQTLSKDFKQCVTTRAQFYSPLKIPVATKALAQLQAHQQNGFVRRM